MSNAIPNRSGDSVRIVVPGLRPGSVVHIRCDARSPHPYDDSGVIPPSDPIRFAQLIKYQIQNYGKLSKEESDAIQDEIDELTTDPMWSAEAWYTLNQIPGQAKDRFPGLLETLGTDPIGDAVRRKRVLVFSKTAGFRHGSIPDGIACFNQLAKARRFAVTATEDAAEFNDANLENYDAVVFLNTTGDVLDGEQQAAFEAWYRDGGAFLGIHSAADTEYDWPWYGRLVGARFQGHPQIQPARMIIGDPGRPTPDHPAISHLGGYPHFDTWTRTDEWYDFRAQPVGSTTTLLRLDGATYNGGRIGDDASMRRTHPICWYHEFDGGRAIYTGGGHTAESYQDPDFRRHLLGCLAWALGAE